MSTLDDFATESDSAAPDDAEDEEECACDDLSDDVPCFPCFADGAEFGGDA